MEADDLPAEDLGWDRNDPDSWFEHEYTPTSAIIDYARAAPRGMTNPPQNPAVRKELFEDLVEFDLDLITADWNKRQAYKHKPSSAPSTPSQLTRGPPPRTASSRTRAVERYQENVRTGRTLKKGGIFSRSDPNVRSGKARATVAWGDENEKTPVHPPWHGCHPFPHTLQPIQGSGPVATVGAGKEKHRSVRFADSPSKRGLKEALSTGFKESHKIEYMRTPSHEKALSAGKWLSLDGDSSSGFVKRPHALDEKRSSKQSTRKIEESELDNGTRGLRGMSNLHRAAVADKFKFCADASVGQPLVLGASSLSKGNPGKWYSDVAYLQKFHNSAIRIVAPSGLNAVKEPKERKKKKKKAESDDDIDELKMTGSDLFVARYPIDESLKCLRRLKKSTFPDQEPPPKAGPSKEEILAQAGTRLKSELGGSILLLTQRFRDLGVDGAKAEMDEAVQQAGYDGSIVGSP